MWKMATVGGVWNSLSYFLFKAWKWVFHLVSGTSEIERICKYPEIVTRTLLLSESVQSHHMQCMPASGARAAVSVNEQLEV